MSEPAKQDPRPMISIDEQIDEIGRQARALERFAGRLTPETRDAKLRRLYAAEATLRTIKQHADGLRSLIGWLKTQQAQSIEWEEPSPALASILLDQPSTRNVIAQFPLATLVASRPISAIERAALIGPQQTEDADNEQSGDAAVETGAAAQ